MNFRLLFAFTLMLLFAGCSKNNISGPYPQTSTIPANEYVVLSTLVDSLYSPASITRLVIDDSTSPGLSILPTDSAMTNYLEYVRQHLSALSSEAIEDFRSKNLTRTYVDAPTSIHPKGVWASEADTALPWLQVSRVGFNSDGRQALVYVGIVWAPLAGYGAFYLLNNTAGKWSIGGSVMTWIS